MKNPLPIELIGMMDSPFVRRVAIALRCHGIPYVNIPLSVYRNPELLAAINPLMTVPVLRFGSEQFIESGLILEWIRTQVDSPWPKPTSALSQAAAVSDVIAIKVGEYYREVGLRVPENRFQPAIARLVRQINAGLHLLNTAAFVEGDGLGMGLNESSVAIATSYAFTKEVDNALHIGLKSTPRLERCCAAVEHLMSQT
jgi:glutathione S-transferase